MEWPLHPEPVADDRIPLWNHYHLAAHGTPSDPTMLWGTDVPVAALQEHLRRTNATADVVVTAAHVLACAVGRALAEHPRFNRRILRRRLRELRRVAILVPVKGRDGAPDLYLLRDVDRRPVADVARELWGHALAASQGRPRYRREEDLFRGAPRALRNLALRLILRIANGLNLPVLPIWSERLRCAAAMVNWLGHRGAPPMRVYKPSRFPNEVCTLNVTMGPAEPTAAGPVAPLFVRADRRLVDGHDLSQMVATLRRYLMEPWTLDAPPPAGGEA